MIKFNNLKKVLISIIAALTLVVGIAICALIPNGGVSKAHAAAAITVSLVPDKESYSTTSTDNVIINVTVKNTSSNTVGAVCGNVKYDSTVFSIGDKDFETYDTWGKSESALNVTRASEGILYFSICAADAANDICISSFVAAKLKFTVKKEAVAAKSYTFELLDDKKLVVNNNTDGVKYARDAVSGTVNFAAPSSNANLSALTVNGKTATLSGNTYTVPAATYKFPYATKSVTIAATAADSGATVTGTGSKNVTWSGNTATLTDAVTVTPPSGASGAKKYTVVITRADPSTDTNGKLVLSGGKSETINLTPSTTSYTVSGTVPYKNHKTVKFVASATSPATVATSGCTINGAAVTLSGNGNTPNLTKGANTVIVKIQAEDPSQSTTYTVTVNVDDPILTLSSVKIGSFTATAQDATTYKVTIPYAQATGSVSVAATPTDSGVVTAAVSGGNSVNLGGSSKTVTITATADNGDNATYTLNIEVGAADDTTSMSLTFGGALTNTLYLSDAQANQSANTESAPIPYASKDNLSVTFTKPANAVSATAKIGSTSYTSGSKLALSAGSNVLVVEVVAQGSVKTSTYNVTIYVAAADTDAGLKTVKLTKPGKSDILGTFRNGKWEFDKSIAPDDTDGWTLVVETTSANTKSVVGAGSLDGKLSSGDNPITVTVTPQDGAPESHIIVIPVAASIGETDLDDIILTAKGIQKTLKQNKNEYSVTLSATETEDVQITATAANAQSKVSVNNGAEKVHTSTEQIPVTGKTTVNIVIISPDGSNRSLYTVIINVYTNDHDADPIGGFHVYAVQGQDFKAETEFLTTAIDPMYNSSYYSDMRKPFTVTTGVETLYFNCVLPAGATATIIGYDENGVQIADPICSDYQSGSTETITLGGGIKFIGVKIISGDGMITKTTQFHFLPKEVKVKITGTDGKIKEFSSAKTIDWVNFGGGDRSNYTLTVEESSEYTAEIVSYKTLNKETSTDWEYNVGLGKGTNAFVIKVTFNDGNVAYYTCNVNNSTGGTNVGLIVALIIFVVLFVAATVVMSVFIAKYVSQNKKYGYRD